jgi:predicted nucleic acid-binding protein
MIFVYYIEEHQRYIGRVAPVFEALARRELAVVASVLCLAEVLVTPMRRGNERMVRRYRDLLTSTENLHLYPADANTATMAARLRSRWNIRTPDAIHLATALHQQAEIFLTNDERLRRVTEMPVAVLDDLSSGG